MHDFSSSEKPSVSRHRFDKKITNAIRGLSTDNWHMLVYWIWDVTIIVLSIVSCYLLSWLFYPMAVIVISTRQRALLAILHDSAHGCAAHHPLLNYFLGSFFTAYPLFFTYHGYRGLHVLGHHPHFGHPIRDPDFQFFMSQGVYDCTIPRKYFLKLVLFPLFGSRTAIYLKYLISRIWQFIYRVNPGTDTQTDTKHQNKGRENDKFIFLLFWFFIISAFGYFGLIYEIILFWLIPYLTVFQILCWFIELSEHTPMMKTESVNLYMTRTRKSRGWESFFFAIHNENYHLDHHLNTKVPFWLLPESRRIRLLDPEYFRVDASMGGLFMKGRNGAPSAMESIFAYHRARLNN